MVMILLIGVFAFPNVLAQAGTLTVQTDKDSYKIGEDIKISGTVPAVIEGVPVAIQVFNPRNTMYTIDQVTPNADGTYSATFDITGKLGINGIYTVKVTYSNQSVQTQFEIVGAYTGGGSIRVEYEGNVFYVNAQLSNGSVRGIDVDPYFRSVIVSISTGYNDGDLTITLPRALIDARFNTCVGSDDRFVVFVDGQEEYYYETDKTSIDRSLLMQVYAGAQEVEIVGSCIVGQTQSPQKPSVTNTSVTVQSETFGETITIKGNAYPVIQGGQVGIQVFNPDNVMYTIDSVTPNWDGSYSSTIKIGGKMGTNGMYTVKINYYGASAQTTFFYKKQVSVSTPKIDGSLDYAIIFLTTWDECTKLNYNALNFYSYLTNQYLNKYGFQTSNPYELCVNTEEFVEQSDRYLRDVADKDAIIIITNIWTSLDMLLNEYSGNSHVDPNWGSFTPYEGKYLILTKSVTWSQASWTVSHELAHMILYHLGTPRSVYADGVHYIDALYENCEDKSQCGDVYFEILYPVDHEYYELMRIDAFVDAAKYEQPRSEPVSTRQYEPEYGWNKLQTSQPVIEQDGQKTSYLSLGSNVLIKTKVSNSQQDIQKFTLLLQVKDSDGLTASLTMLENATIDRADTSTISLSWIPFERGIYTVEVFVWENANNPTALAPMNSLQVIVS